MPFKKPTLEQVAWVFEMINKNAGGSFRKLIYDRLGFGPNAYSELYAAGGQNITNGMCAEIAQATEEDLIDLYLDQIEVLRPVYEAAKVLQGACYFGVGTNITAASKVLTLAVSTAARELEDSDE
jgi:hypothetical protein